MQRIMCPERDDWQQTAEQCGFAFHTIDGERYWDERAYYAFTLDEIERSIETPTGEIDAMCLELAGRVIGDERHLRRLKIPETFWDLIAESWERDDRSLYGRLDLKFDGNGPAKLLEYNADTPTSIFEAAVFQWTWLEQAIERRIIPARADQFNSIHERLIAAWKTIGVGHHLHLTGTTGSEEDAGTLAYLEDTARQAGLSTTLLDIEEIGWHDEAGGFVDLDDRDMALVFKLYPWEWMFHDAFGAKLAGAPTRWIEPPWKAVLSNKGILPLLWEMFPSQSAAGLLRGRSARSRARQLLRPQAAAVARRRQCHAAVGRNVTRRARRPLRRRRLCAPGAVTAAELFRRLSGGGELAGEPRAVRAFDPRGREPDHGQQLAVSAARDLVRCARDPAARGASAEIRALA